MSSIVLAVALSASPAYHGSYPFAVPYYYPYAAPVWYTYYPYGSLYWYPGVPYYWGYQPVFGYYPSIFLGQYSYGYLYASGVVVTAQREEVVPRAVARAERATFRINVPADATLYFDDRLVKAAGREQQTFETPPLENGADYYYVVRAEATRDGQKVSGTRRVTFRAGSAVEVLFPEFEPRVVQAGTP